MDIVEYVVGLLANSGLVSPLVGSRIYAGAAPQTPVAPYIVASLVDDVPTTTLEGWSRLTRARIQIDAYATTHSAVAEISLAVADAINVDGDFSRRPILGPARRFYDAPTRLHQATRDLIVWHIPAVTSP